MQRKIATLQFLGTGASSGVPVIGCRCSVCLSSDPRNRRLRASSLICCEGKHYLIDAGPDMRFQALQYGIDRIDGVVLTHTHFDHIGGLEDLRVYNFIQERAIPCVLSQESMEEVKLRFHYYFKEVSVENSSLPAKFDFHPLPAAKGIAYLESLPFQYTTYKQGEASVLGLRFGDLAYLTDMKSHESTIFEFLKDVRVLVVGALRFTPSQMHFTIDEAVDFCQKAGAEESYFIHMSHEVDYEKAETLLPKGIFLAYDGLTVQFKV